MKKHIDWKKVKLYVFVFMGFSVIIYIPCLFLLGWQTALLASPILSGFIIFIYKAFYLCG